MYNEFDLRPVKQKVIVNQIYSGQFRQDPFSKDPYGYELGEHKVNPFIDHINQDVLDVPIHFY